MRRWLAALMLVWPLLAGAAPPVEAPTLRIGLTPIFPQGRYALLARWQDYLGARLGRPVRFITRESYRDTMEQLRHGRLDAAWLCDCPFVTDNPEFRLLATPSFQGSPYYRAYLIVPAEDRRSRGIGDLAGKVFAYADPHSNAGYLTPRHDMLRQGRDPERFFRRTFHAWSHLGAIEAVADGLADGASVNSYIWETLHKQSPMLTTRTRVASKSPEYGFPPLVAGRRLPLAEFEALRGALLAMDGDPDGRELLEKMNLDRFLAPKPEYYQRVRELVRAMAEDVDARDF